MEGLLVWWFRSSSESIAAGLIGDLQNQNDTRIHQLASVLAIPKFV
jgi:hypothetical protein